MEQKTKLNVGKVLKLILLVIGLLIIFTAVFAFFKVRIDAKTALRDAKDVRMALTSADIEMYAAGKSVFNPTKKNGIEDGAKEKAEQIFISVGDYKITSYDKKNHEITGFQYEVGNYIVTFHKHGEAISWDVDFILRVYSYDDEDVIVSGD